MTQDDYLWHHAETDEKHFLLSKLWEIKSQIGLNASLN